MSKIRRRLLIKSSALFALGAAATTALGSCQASSPSTSEPAATGSDGAASGSAKSEVLRVGLVPWLGWGEAKIAEANGYFEAAGVAVEQTLFQTVTEVNTAFLSEQIDLAWLVAADLLVLAETANNLKFIYASDYSGQVDAIIGRNIAEPKAIAGKTLAREEVPYEIVFVAKFLDSVGLTEKEVKVVPLTAADGATALVAENLDAVATYEPFVSNALKASDDNKILFTAEGTNIIINGLAARAAFLQAKREPVLAYLKAIEQANQFLASNPKESHEIIAKWVGVTPQEVSDLMGKVTKLDIADNQAIAFAADNSLNVASSLDSAGPILVSAGAAKKAIPGADLVDASFVNGL